MANFWFGFLMIVFIIDIIILIPVVLLQSGSGAQSGMFGSELTIGAFGAKTSEVLLKITKWLVGIFFVTAFLMGYIKVRESGAFDNRPRVNQPAEQQEAPAADTNAAPGLGMSTNAGMDTNLPR